jgi:hypothetical protein
VGGRPRRSRRNEALMAASIQKDQIKGDSTAAHRAGAGQPGEICGQGGAEGAGVRRRAGSSLEHDALELDRFAVSAKHQRSRVPDAAQRLISAFTRVFDTLWAVHRGAQAQNRENNPMQSRMGPAALVRLASGAREERWSVVTVVTAPT